MGAAKTTLAELGYKDAVIKDLPYGMHTSQNEWSECVSEDEFCKLQKTFSKVSHVKLAFIQAEMVALGMQGTIMNSIDDSEEEAKETLCDTILDTGGTLAGPLEDSGLPPAVIMARIFGMLQCYLDMLTSDDKDRGREYGRCTTKAVLRLVFYLATEFTALGALDQAKVLGKVGGALGHADEVLDKSQAIDDAIEKARSNLDKVQENLDKAVSIGDRTTQLAEQFNVTETPAWNDWGIAGTLNVVEAAAEVVTKVSDMTSSIENMFVESSTLVVAAVLDHSLDLNGWAKTQPHLQYLDGACHNMTDKIVEAAFDKMRQITNVAFEELREFVGNMSVTDERPIETCTVMPTTGLCGALGHSYKIDRQFTDANMFSCHEKSIVKKYQALLGRPRLAEVLSSHPVCEDSMRDLLCLSSYRPCGEGSECLTYTPCMIACRNLNTCARSLAFDPPFDCAMQCSCGTKCYDSAAASPLQSLTERKNLCTELCQGDPGCATGCESEFKGNMQEACAASDHLTVSKGHSNVSKHGPDALQQKYLLNKIAELSAPTTQESKKSQTNSDKSDESAVKTSVFGAFSSSLRVSPSLLGFAGVALPLLLVGAVVMGKLCGGRRMTSRRERNYEDVTTASRLLRQLENEEAAGGLE